MRPDANTPWFTFSAESGDFKVYSFQGIEEVNEPYEFIVEIVSRSANENIDGFLRKPAHLAIKDRSGGERLVHGIVRQMEQLHTGNVFTHYRVVLVPLLWYLQRIIDHRIFQHLSVVEIIQKILKEQGFSENETSFKLSVGYGAREYCVQYGESDLHFITRLCEEEGIYFYFEHKKDSHCLCFCDAAGGPKIEGENALRFYEGSGHSAETAVITRLRLQHTVNSNAATFKEWNFTQPKLDLTVSQKETNQKKAPVPHGMLLEQYRYPHIYDLRAPGTRYAGLQLERQLTFTRWIECESDVSRFLPSFTFTVEEHDREDVNTGWWTVSVHHHGEQPGVLEHEAPSGRGMQYSSYVKAIPETTRFVPENVHPKNRIVGNQTAIVTGPEGEEIYTDKYGRVKVQFFWDREGKWDENSSCWIRVSQGWAGRQYGMMILPRVGHEVEISFMEGDPDRPQVCGRYHHDLNMPPYSLPENKTRSTMKSKTYKGDGYNEIRFEDMQGNEQIYVHAQFDKDAIIENDSREWVKGFEHLLVGKDRVEEIAEISSSQAGKDRLEGTGGKRSITVGGDEAHHIGGALHVKSDGTMYIQCGVDGVIEMKDLTLKAPGGFIRITDSGVVIQGKTVNINHGGSPGSGTIIQSVPARSAMYADSRDAKTGQKSEARLVEQDEVMRSSGGGAAVPASFGGESFVASPVSTEASDMSVGALSSGLVAGSITVMALLKEAPVEIAQLKTGTSPIAQEWRKSVLEAKMEPSISNKMETVNSFVQKNVAVTGDAMSAQPQGPAALLQSGKGSELECAIAKYQTLQEAGVPADSMKIVATNQGSMLMVQDGPHTLVAGSDFTPGMPMVRDSASLPPGITPQVGFGANSLFSFSPVKG